MMNEKYFFWIVWCVQINGDFYRTGIELASSMDGWLINCIRQFFVIVNCGDRDVVGVYSQNFNYNLEKYND